MEHRIPMEVDDSELSGDEFEPCWPAIFKCANPKDKEDNEYLEHREAGLFIARPFPRSMAKELHESWHVVESAAAQWGLKCKLSNKCYIAFESTEDLVGDGFIKGRDVLALLSVRVPADRAIRVLMNGVPRDIIRTGHHRHGICTQFGIKKDEYRKRKKLLMTLPEKELAALTGCEIYFRPKNDVVAAIGPDVGLKLARKIVTDCIVRRVPPARRIKDLLNRAQLSKRLQKLSLG